MKGVLVLIALLPRCGLEVLVSMHNSLSREVSYGAGRLRSIRKGTRRG